MAEQNGIAGSVLDLSPVIPVVVLHDPAAAVPLARALLAGGIGLIELTLRTPAALDCARAITAEVPEIVLGIGTALTPRDAVAAAAAGARFLVSPGATPDLLAAAAETGLPFLPGVATPSEAMRLLEIGISEMKFFPAEQVGGAPLLAALRSPLPQIRFCPTGGIGPTTAPAYLALPNVGCVGGSWLTPADAVAAGDWARIENLARTAVTTLGRSGPSSRPDAPSLL